MFMLLTNFLTFFLLLLLSFFFFCIFPPVSPEISVERPVVFSGEGHEATLVCIVHGETQPEVCFN